MAYASVGIALHRPEELSRLVDLAGAANVSLPQYEALLIWAQSLSALRRGKTAEALDYLERVRDLRNGSYKFEDFEAEWSFYSDSFDVIANGMLSSSTADDVPLSLRILLKDF